MENHLPDKGIPSRLSAAQKLQRLKTQQAKLKKRAMPVHSRLKMNDMKKKGRIKKSSHIETSSSSKKSSVRFIPTSDANGKHKSGKKEDVLENAKWKRRTQIIYEVERIGIQLKEIMADCEEREVDLDTAKQDLMSGFESLQKSRDEYYEFARGQKETFYKRIKQIGYVNNSLLEDLCGKIKYLNESIHCLDSKMDKMEIDINEMRQKQSAQTTTQKLVEYLKSFFG